jgi:hypothetical protein
VIEGRVLKIPRVCLKGEKADNALRARSPRIMRDRVFERSGGRVASRKRVIML